jgi:hypothetical protein
VSTLDVLEVASISMIDIVNLNNAEVKINFVDKEDVPLLYELLLAIIKEMKTNTSNPRFDYEALDGFIALANTLYDAFFLRLKRYFFKKHYGNTEGYTDGVTIDKVTFKRVTQD